MLTREDANVVDRFVRTGENRNLIDGWIGKPGVVDGLFEALELDVWAMPMLASHGAEPAAVLLNVMSDVQSMNTRLVPIVADFDIARVALPMYVRHLFWTLPVHRIWAQFVADLTRHSELVAASGFREEGVLIEHQIRAGRRCDVVVFGLLRRDFELWCRVNAPELSLDQADL